MRSAGADQVAAAKFIIDLVFSFLLPPNDRYGMPVDGNIGPPKQKLIELNAANGVLPNRNGEGNPFDVKNNPAVFGYASRVVVGVEGKIGQNFGCYPPGAQFGAGECRFI